MKNINRVGIWGLGAVGTSALHYFSNLKKSIEILDVKKQNDESLQFLPKTVVYTQQSSTTIEQFIKRNDIILASPGIDITPYAHYRNKFITELDLLKEISTIPLIGITGTIGKTTLTTLIYHILHDSGLSIGMGGNIGTPMLDLVQTFKKYDYLVLELSSFQLEHTKTYSPYLAIWTNFYPNHLDRHRCIENYFFAKCNIFAHQKNQQQVILPFKIVPLLKKYNYFEQIQSNISFFSVQPPSQDECFSLSKMQFFYIQNDCIVMQKNSTILPLIPLKSVALNTYKENFLILTAMLYNLNKNIDILKYTHQTISLEHRLEHVATYRGISFYNDSKATVMQATLAAIYALKEKNIVLLLGGISKGVDRTIDIQKISGMVTQIICFGKEADMLAKACMAAHIPAQKTFSLDQAFELALKGAKKDMCILLSPGGASFDLFKNYQARGNRFKELIVSYGKRAI